MILAYHGATSMKSDLETDVKATSKAGFKALDLWASKVDDYLKTHSVSDLDSLLKSNNVKCNSISSIEFIAFRGAEYEKIRNRCKQLCEISEAIGRTKIVVVPSPTPKMEDGELNFPWEKVVDEYVAVLKDLSDIAKPRGALLSFEFLGFAWCTVRTPKGLNEIVQKVARENVGISFDSCHFYAGGGELSEIEALKAKDIFEFHLNDLEDIPKEAITDAKRLLPGLGVIKIDGILSRIKNVGYDGYCAVEIFRPEYWDWDPYVLAAEAKKTATKVLSPHFNVE